MMKALSLFSGIGGLDLAASAAGIVPVAFFETDPFAVKILERRFPGVENLGDVRYFTTRMLRELGGNPFVEGKCPSDYAGSIDVVYGGFPCQDLSVAGKRAGLDGSRSGLWYEMLRIISEVRPIYVLAENVRGAVNLALPIVTSGLEGEGYKVWASVVPASAFGAPHKRERLFVLGVRCDVADAVAGRLFEHTWESALSKRSERTATCGKRCLWPTPSVKGNYNRRGLSERSGNGLETAVKMWPTLRSRDAKSEGFDAGIRRNSPTLPTTVKCVEIAVTRNGEEDSMQQHIEAGDFGNLNPDWASLLMGFPYWWTDIEREMLCATTITTVSGEMLFVVREENGKEIMRRPVQGYETFSAEEISLSSMCWEEAQKEMSGQNREKVELFQKREMRNRWEILRIGNLPFNREQSDDIVCCLSCEMTLGEWKRRVEETVGLQNLWCACQEAGYVPETLSALREVWRYLSCQEKNLVVACAMGRTPFPSHMNESQYHYEPPRVCKSVSNRGKRLKVLGNAVVPIQAYPFFEAIGNIHDKYEEKEVVA
jgi:DNA (cytosine-5)-methyltransferase 1